MNTLSAQQIGLLTGLSITLLIILPLSYYSLAKIYGRRLANRLMPNTVFVLALIMLVFCLLLIPLFANIDAYFFIIFFGMAVLWWSRVIVFMFERSKKPRILLDLGLATPTISSVFIPVLTVVGIGLILLAPFAQHLYFIFWGLMSLAQAAWYFLQDRERALITDRGLQIPPTTIPWTRIKNYEWANEIKVKASLVVQSRNRPMLFDTQVL